jgi:dihydrofolate reductase
MMQIIAIAAISVDGCITKHCEEGTAFTSPEDKKFFRDVLQGFDCCIFGSKTFLASKAGILRNVSRERLRIVVTRSPEKYAAYHHPELLEFTSDLPEEIVADLQRRRKKRCAVLGGGEIYTLFFARHLLDQLWLTIEPKVFGEGKKLAIEKTDVRLLLKNMQKLSENTILIKYTIAPL